MISLVVAGGALRCHPQWEHLLKSVVAVASRRPHHQSIPQSRWSLNYNSRDSYIVNLLLHVISFKDICTYNVRRRYTVYR